MKRPTDKRIDEQISSLKRIKPKVKQDHHDAIDAQIEVLEHLYTSWEIDKRNAFEDTNVREAAEAARQWLDGKYEDYPDLVASWKGAGK